MGIELCVWSVPSVVGQTKMKICLTSTLGSPIVCARLYGDGEGFQLGPDRRRVRERRKKSPILGYVV